MDAEKVMDGIIEEVYMLNGEIAACLKTESYEKAALLRDGINAKLDMAIDSLIDKELTKLNRDELEFYLYELSHGFLVDWCDIMEIDAPERAERE